MLTTALSCAAASCGNSEETSGTRSASACPPLATSVDARLDVLKGPLGCTPSSSFLPNPPGGCDGVETLVEKTRQGYAALLQEGGCTGEAPSLEGALKQYEADFAVAHPFASHTIVRGAYTIAAREFGAEHARNGGPAIVLMHGFPDDQHLYDLLAPPLGEKMRTITFDFVGWGDSTHPQPGEAYAYTVENLRADLDAVVDYFHLDSVVAVVHDASGWPGIDWALDNETRTTALVLLNTVYHAAPGTAPPYVIRALSTPDMRSTFLEAVGDDDVMSRALFRAQVGSFFTDDAARAAHLPVLEARLVQSRPGLYGLTDGLGEVILARNANVPRMNAFRKPVVIAFGADDPFLNPMVAQAFADAFPTSKLTLVPSANHYVQLDAPDALVPLILDAAKSP